MKYAKFSEIASVYDRFNDLSVYEHWLDFTLNSLDTRPEKALDVATGTGMFAQLLAPFVSEVVAIDVDEGMLEIARKESDSTCGLTFEHANMLDLSEYAGIYDLVTCYADSLCFLEDFDQVTCALQEMYNCLKEDGTLLFDAWSVYMLTEGFKGFNYFDSDPTAALLWDSETHGRKHMVDHYLTVFNQESTDESYTRRDVHLQEKTYPVEDFTKVLKDLGFQQIEVLVNFGQEAYDPQKHSDIDRIFYRCIK